MSTPPGAMRTVDGAIVGRRAELGALRAWLAAAREGAGQLVLCVGAPGIGKTRLAQELAGAALAAGTAVAWGRCVDTEGAPAFWPWRQVLRSLGVDPDTVLDRDVESPEDRFAVFADVAARAMADGTWRRDRPPGTVLDVVRARLDRVSADCRAFVQAAAIVGRDVELPLVAATLGSDVGACLPLVDEAIAHGLLDRVGAAHRFVHALTRDAVEASLGTADRVALHRAVAVATEAQAAGDLGEHLTDIAGHWAHLAPYGEAETAGRWAAAAEAVRRLAYEHGVRLYRAALDLHPARPFTDIDTFDRLTAQFDGAPAGMQARYAGTAEDGKLRVISLWESKEHASRFFADTLGPALARVLGPEPVGVPVATGIAVLRNYAREPVS